MKRKFKNAFVWEDEKDFKQLCIADELLQPFLPYSADAERTVSVKMRSEYASTDAESEEVATTKADDLSATSATSKAKNVGNNIFYISADEDAFSLDDAKIELVKELQVCEDCTNCDDFKKCHERNDK